MDSAGCSLEVTSGDRPALPEFIPPEAERIIVTPMLSGAFLSYSAVWAFAPGALPYLVTGSLVLAVSPVPLLLRRLERRSKAA